MPSELQLSSSVKWGTACFVGFLFRVTGMILEKDLVSCLARRRSSLKPVVTFTTFASVPPLLGALMGKPIQVWMDHRDFWET